jgi:hypothetical protein
MNKKEMIIYLMDNFKAIQDRIDEIKAMKQLDIKQISDLQRYVEMQMNITHAIFFLGGDLD